MNSPATVWSFAGSIRRSKPLGNGSSEPIAGNVPMNVLMPQLGATAAEGKITKWFKSAGGAVQPGDNLFEIETDKVSMEVPAIEAGVLSEIRVPEGEVAPVGAIVGVIGDAGAAAIAPAAKAETPKAVAAAVAAPPASERAL